MKNLFRNTIAGILVAAAFAGFGATAAAHEFKANVAVNNNYVWRGLTQSTNEPTVSGGIDYVHDNGFYIGTWASNVQYAADDVFSFEHDVYFGYAGEAGDISYDIGYLYANYDSAAMFDFGEIHGTIGYGGFSATAYVFVHTEADEAAGVAALGRPYDFHFGETFYLSADYAFVLENELEIAFHAGYHDGDFVDAFNFADGTTSYVDYSVSFSKDGFFFTISDTDLDTSPVGLQNDSPRFVVGYSMEFDLN